MSIMAIVIGNEIGNLSLNPGWVWLGKAQIHLISSQLWENFMTDWAL